MIPEPATGSMVTVGARLEKKPSQETVALLERRMDKI